MREEERVACDALDAVWREGRSFRLTVGAVSNKVDTDGR